MKTLLLYSLITGNPIGRITISDDSQITHYPNSIEINSTEHDSQPEIWRNVNVKTKRLEDAPDEKIRERLGLKPTEALPKRPMNDPR